MSTRARRMRAAAATATAMALMTAAAGHARPQSDGATECARTASSAASVAVRDSGAAPRSSAAGAERTPRELMDRARSRYERLESMTARFEQTVTVPLLDQESHGTGRWYQKGAGRFKMEFTDPPNDVIVADGEHLWLYYPSSHPGQVIRTTIEASTTGQGMADLQGRIFQEARSGYRIEAGGEQRVSDTRTEELVLTPMEGTVSPYRRVRVWVGLEDLLVRKFEIVEENETVRTVRLWDLDPGTAVSDSVFRFRVPDGVEVFSG